MPKTDIATFNVNSVKSRLPILDTWLSSDGAPDILCLQETKCRDEEFPAAFFEERGYSWVLMDYGDVIVHVFSKEDRLFYDLERIWKDGKKISREEL